MRTKTTTSASAGAAANSYRRIYAVVERIPSGRVATYGQVAAVAGLAGRARQVGYALHALPEGSEIPWHRVINARGEVSPRADPEWEGYQRFLLAEEGVDFDLAGRTDLARFGWQPRLRATRPPRPAPPARPTAARAPKKTKATKARKKR